MKHVSIYNSYIGNNISKREYMEQMLTTNGFTLSKNGELTLVIGGDGTFLSAIRKRLDKPTVFAGFNTGNLGFLSEFSVERLSDFISMVQQQRYWIQELPVYEVHIKEAKSKHKRIEYFVNDLVIERKTPRILHMSVHLGEEELGNISADGVILSTPLGATGYNASSGGSILIDCENVLQLTPVSPVRSAAYQSLATPILYPDHHDLTIFPNYKKQRSYRIVCDGKEIDTKHARFVTIHKSEKTIAILRSNGYSTLSNICEKMFGKR